MVVGVGELGLELVAGVRIRVRVGVGFRVRVSMRVRVRYAPHREEEGQHPARGACEQGGGVVI